MKFSASRALVVFLVAAVSAGQEMPSIGAPLHSLRTTELLRFDCSAKELSKSVVLFGNGTVRIREMGGPNDGLLLAELYPEELTAFKHRFREIDLSEAEDRTRGPSGEFVEQCLLKLAQDLGAEREFRFVRMAALDLALNRVLVVIDDVVRLATERARRTVGLAGYEPRIGDVLAKENGNRYRIERWTGDGKGAEIAGLDDPLVLYMGRDEVRYEFTEIVRRRRP